MTGETFGTWLARRMATLGLNQADLARRSGVTGPTVSRWINDTTTPAPHNLRLLAAPLQTPYETLMNLAGHGNTGTPTAPIHPRAAELDALLSTDSHLTDAERAQLNDIVDRVLSTFRPATRRKPRRATG